MKDKLVMVKLVLLLVAAPLAIWFGALKGTVSDYAGYVRLGRELAPSSVLEDGVDLSRLSGTDLVSDGSVIAGIEKAFAGTGVRVSSYVPGAGKEEAGLVLREVGIELKGDYRTLLKVLAFLEEDGRYAVSDISFERKDVRERSVTLRINVSQLLKDE